MREVIAVKKKNQAQLKIEVNDYNILQELTKYFSAYVPGYKFMPAFKQGIWSGKIYFFQNQLLPIGLLSKLYKFAESGDYDIDKQFEDHLPLTEEDLHTFIENLELPDHFEIRDYQFKSAYDAIKNKRLSIKANTAAGKSLIMYIVVRFMLAAEKRVLLVVPSTHLVGQMYTDWEEYGWTDIHESVEQIYGGMPNEFNRPVVISTWQSMFEKKKVRKKMVTKLRKAELFNTFECLMFDEAHSCKATSLKDIAAACKNAEWRIGLSGTFPEENDVDWFTIVGAIGDITPYTSYQSLRASNHVSHLTIENLFIDYSLKERELNYYQHYKDYHAEVDYIEKLEARNRFIVNLAMVFETNTIMLFTKIAHGRLLFNMLEEAGAKVFHIDGSTAAEERNLIRQRMEANSGIVLVASYGTFSQGVNIKNVHQIIAASNYKKFYKVVQSIGRGLRRIEGLKEEVTMYNIVDDLRYKVREFNYVNYLYQHYQQRMKVYKNEGYDDINKTIIHLT